METKPFSVQSPEDIAKQYGGNKQKIAQAMQSGVVDPTAGLLAGMFIDRMRSAQAQEMGQQPTVAQQVMAPPPAPAAPMGMPGGGGLGAIAPGGAIGPGGAPAAPTAPPAPPPGGAPMGMADGGLASLPVPDDMFSAGDETGYAGGGIVAFAAGSPGEEKEKRSDDELLRLVTDPRTPEEVKLAAAQELRSRGRAVSDYGAPMTAGEVGEAFSAGLPQGLAKVGTAIGRGVMGSQFARDISTVPEAVSDFAKSEEAARAAAALTAPAKGFLGASRWALGMPPASEAAAKDAPPRMAPEEEALAAANTGLGGLVPGALAADPRFAQAQGTATLEDLIAMGATPRRGLGALAPTAPAAPAAPAAPTAAEQAPAAAKPDEMQAYLDALGPRPELSYLKGIDLDKQRKQDMWAALAQLGFGMAASKSPSFLGALGESATAALPGMQKSQAERRAMEREMAKAQYDEQMAARGERGEARKFQIGREDVAAARAMEERKFLWDQEKARISADTQLKVAGMYVGAKDAAPITDRFLRLYNDFRAKGLSEDEAATKASDYIARSQGKGGDKEETPIERAAREAEERRRAAQQGGAAISDVQRRADAILSGGV